MPQQPDIWDIAARGGQTQNQPNVFDQADGTAQPNVFQDAARDIWDEAAAGSSVFDQADGSYNKNAAPKLKQPVKVESSLMDRLSGALAPQTVPQTKRRTDPGNLNAFEGSYSSGDTDKAAAMTGAGIAAGTALVGAGVAPRAIAAAKALGQWVSANPVKAYLLYEAAKDLLPGHLHDLFKAAQKSPQ